MREILFRAKGKGSGKWLYGYYARLSDARGLKDVLYATVGLRSLEQFVEQYEIDPEDRPDLFYDDDSYQE